MSVCRSTWTSAPYGIVFSGKLPTGRGVAWVYLPCEVHASPPTYVYGHRKREVTLEPQPAPTWFLALTGRVMALFGIRDPSLFPDSCHLSRYDHGGIACGWHSDSEPLMEDSGACRPIVSLSLGDPRWFEVAASWSDAPGFTSRKRRSIYLRHGDIVVMSGAFQDAYVHRVPKDPSSRDLRINLTWRWCRRVPRADFRA